MRRSHNIKKVIFDLFFNGPLHVLKAPKWIQEIYYVFCFPALIIHELSHLVIIILFRPFLTINLNEFFIFKIRDKRGWINPSAGFCFETNNRLLIIAASLSPFFAYLLLILLFPQFWWYYVFSYSSFMPSATDIIIAEKYLGLNK